MINPGKGTLLQVESATPGTYTTIAQRTTIGGPSMSNGEKDQTGLDDTCHKAAASILDPGELNLTIQYDPKQATHTKLTDLLVSGLPVNWWLIFMDATVITNRSKFAFTGWVKTFQPTGFEVESDVTADLTIRLTTVPTITAGT